MAERHGPDGRARLPVALLSAASFGFLLVQLDVSIVNVALPTIGDGLETGVAGLQWIVDAYALTFAAFLLLAGSLSDGLGARRVFVAGLASFLLASFACGLSPNAALLVGVRLVQGVGAALMVPSSLALLNHACAGDAALRHRMVGLWTAAGSVGLALGPAAGGLLVGPFGWRSIFLVNLPLGGLALAMTLRHVPDRPGQGGRFDAPGQALALLALFALVGAPIEAGERGWTAPVVIGAVALAAAAAFVLVEMRVRDPMLPLRFFRDPSFSAALAVGAVVNFTVYGTLFLVSLALQRGRGLGPAETGWVFLPATVAVGIANVAAGGLAARIGARTPMTGGLATAALGFALMRPLTETTPLATVVVGLVLMGAGIGAAVPAMTSALLAGVPPERGGVASGILNTVRQAAGAMGVGVFGTLFATGGLAGARVALTAALALSGAGIVAAWVAGRPHGPRPPADRAA